MGKLSTVHCSPRHGTPFQVQVRCMRLTRIWDRMRDKSRMWLCFVLFCCLVLYSSITKTCIPFCCIKGLLNGLLVK